MVCGKNRRIIIPKDTNINLTKSLTFILILGVALAACSEGRDDILGTDEELTEGSLTKGAGGPNTVVSLSNQARAGQDINEEVASAFTKTYVTISAAGRLFEPTRVMGNYSGYIVVDDSPIKATFYDYSDEGYLFLGGVLLYSGSWQGDILINGTVKFAGTYGGFIEYNGFRIPTDDNGNIISIFAPCETFLTVKSSGSFTFKSGDNILTLNPYPVVVDVFERLTCQDSIIIIYICDPDYSAMAENTSQLSAQRLMFQQ